MEGLADAETYPLQKKQHSFEFLRSIAHLRPRTNTFGAIARVRNCVSADPRVPTARGLPLRSHADYHGQRLRRRGSDVPRDHARFGQPTETGRPDRLPSGFLRTAHVPHGERAVGRRDLRLRPGQDLHLRAYVSRGELEYDADIWPSSGWSSPKWPFSTSTTTWTSPSGS